MTEPNPANSNPIPTPTSPRATDPQSVGTQLRNLLVVLVATGLVVAVVFGFRTQTTTATLASLAATAVPYDTAIANGKPSLMEFYADWCTSCQLMVEDMAELRQTYGDQVNFVMLNVDNRKWLPEMMAYRVDGIPHFVYLDQDGQAIATAIGEQPQAVMAENLTALVAATPLPQAQATGKTSDLTAPTALNTPLQAADDPRAHGSQVQP